MAEAGGNVLYPLVDLAVMWFLRVSCSTSTSSLICSKQAEQGIPEKNRPDAVVLIDYPGFHWHLARVAKKHGIPVIYFVPPQIWAWGWLASREDQEILSTSVLCSLPFEPAWYRDRGFHRSRRRSAIPYFRRAGRACDRRLVRGRTGGSTWAARGDLARLADSGSHPEPAGNGQGRRQAGGDACPMSGSLLLACSAKHRNLASGILEAIRSGGRYRASRRSDGLS